MIFRRKQTQSYDFEEMALAARAALPRPSAPGWAESVLDMPLVYGPGGDWRDVIRAISALERRIEQLEEGA